MTVMYTRSTGAQVAATVLAASECGQFVAKLMAKLFITHRHQHIELNYARIVHCQELPTNLQTPPGIISKQLDTTRNYQYTSRHH